MKHKNQLRRCFSALLCIVLLLSGIWVNDGFVYADYIYDNDADFETNLNNQGFPESYKTLLRQLHASHPNWIFTADHLSMTWEEAVRNESLVGKSLVEKGSKASWKSMMQYAYNWQTGSYVPYDSGGWVTAERGVVEYYMEPRNFLNENYIYMFLDQSYNPSIQNKAGLQKILNGTFMEGAFPEDTYDTYSDVIMAAAEQSGVSPYVLAASIIIEQGTDGSGGSISGTVSGYEGYYNYFNIRAYASGGYDAVQYGLLYAKGEGSLGRPWNTRAKSIIGGAEHYANGYVKRGQDNLYYKKFNVIVPDFYYNQYMTNVQGAYLETGKLKSAYSSVNADAQLTFAIPVYKQMPETNNTALPTSSGANNYYLTSITVDGAVLAQASSTQGVLYTNEYEMIVDSYISKINISATTPSGATVSGTGEIPLNTGMNKIILTVTAASGKTADYVISVFREKDNAPQAPSPIVEKATSSSVTLVAVSGCEYSMDKIIWQKNNVFSGLEPAAAYVFYQRYAETDTTKAGPSSEGLSASTDKITYDKPEKPVLQSKDANSVTLAYNFGYEYSKDGISWQKSNSFGNLKPSTQYSFYQRIAETGISYASKPSDALVVTTDKLSQSAPSEPTLISKTDEQIVLEKISGYEYRINDGDWQKSNVFSGLTASTQYELYQRLAETDTSYASEASQALLVITNAPPAPDTITSSVFTVGENCISKIAAGTDVDTLLSGINEKKFCMVYSGNSVVSGQTAVGTGMVLKIMDGNNMKASYTIIVTGDTNGDGKITVTDMLSVKSHILNKTELSGALATAADTNGDGIISITDFIQIKASILGKGSITER